MIAKKILLALVAATLVALQAGAVCAQSLQADSSDQSSAASEGNKSKDLAGSWQLDVSTQGIQPFKGLITFDKGGGLVASAQGDILLNPPPGVPPVATSGHGAWVKTGKHEFLMTFRQIFYDSSGSYQGGLKLRGAATLNDAGDELSAQYKFEYFDAAGNVTFSGEGTMQGTRIKPEPLLP